MRKLDRAAVPVPECLQNAPDGWCYKRLRREETAQIRNALFQIQGSLCAYCERRTGEDSNDGHIEHFRNQADYPDLTLGWDNLFWSCNDESSCGKCKDGCTKHAGRRSRFEPDNLIDPSVVDPDEFLLFLSDGTVRPKDGLLEEQEQKARETLRVFNLDQSAYLRKSREDAVKPYISMFALLQQKAPDQLAAFIESERENIASRPFSAAIRHFLRDYA